mgnify:CR=1 FL=1
MRRYWEIDQTFAQPSESLLKKNLKESVKSKKKREISWSRLLFPAGQLQKAGGEKPGVTIWSTMRILQAGWSVGSVMCGPEQ